MYDIRHCRQRLSGPASVDKAVRREYGDSRTRRLAGQMHPMPRRLKPPSLWISDDDRFEHHGAAILLMVRDSIADDWQSLCRALKFDRDARSFHSGHLGLKEAVERLV